LPWCRHRRGPRRIILFLAFFTSRPLFMPKSLKNPLSACVEFHGKLKQGCPAPSSLNPFLNIIKLSTRLGCFLPAGVHRSSPANCSSFQRLGSSGPFRLPRARATAFLDVHSEKACRNPPVVSTRFRVPPPTPGSYGRKNSLLMVTYFSLLLVSVTFSCASSHLSRYIVIMSERLRVVSILSRVPLLSESPSDGPSPEHCLAPVLRKASPPLGVLTGPLRLLQWAKPLLV